MKRWPSERSTMQGLRFRRGPFCFPSVDLGKRFKIHPAYIPRLATNSGSSAIRSLTLKNGYHAASQFPGCGQRARTRHSGERIRPVRWATTSHGTV